MTKQITKKQHFAPRFYFKRFAVDNLLQTLDIQKGQVIKAQPYGGVCYADFYYAIETGKEDETSQVFEQFFGEIEDKFAKEYNTIVDTIWNYKPLTDQQLDILAWFMASLWIRSPHMRNQVNKTMADGMKQITSLMASHPNFADGTKQALKEEGLEVTDEQIEDARKTFESGEYELTFDNNVNHLQLIAKCEEFHRWFVIKKWRFYLAKGSKKFITTDTPVIEIFNKTGATLVEKMYGNHIAQRRHYLALTPEILIELIDPLKPGKKQKRQAIRDDEMIIQSNLLLVRYSKDYAYATKKEYLEDLLDFYTGVPSAVS
ncbi:MAG: DUF4238 domain-containing protein [Candidatus Microsaccharimonas sp.]